MTPSAAPRSTARPSDDPVPRPVAVVWIDARQAIVARWRGGASALMKLASHVPPHHRSTGHVRHDPAVRHGGGGPAQRAGEPRRLARLARFLDTVAARLAPDEDVLILGPGTVRTRLLRLVGAMDQRRRLVRSVIAEPATRLTEPQLLARLRQASGQAVRRSGVGGRDGRSPAHPWERDSQERRRPHAMHR